MPAMNKRQRKKAEKKYDQAHGLTGKIYHQSAPGEPWVLMGKASIPKITPSPTVEPAIYYYRDSLTKPWRPKP